MDRDKCVKDDDLTIDDVPDLVPSLNNDYICLDSEVKGVDHEYHIDKVKPMFVTGQSRLDRLLEQHDDVICICQFNVRRPTM